ncbi:peptidase M76 family-domain-containing protein [Suillus discolor]|uniref:Mitochondrial inner membrane protease ATP23 n=1 Tax=Suillus discolor TaxID=1912936 RepID=A0A9P7F4F2_9AGAM|nr:peptidase M76 family-domain-containing protein [Suillus discolor]KAG2107027.1 peptidase M76 family-domain-containing protein [Suillus discolor]
MDPASSEPPVNPSESRSFQRWLHKAAQVSGMGLTADEREHDRVEAQHRRCEQWKTELLNYSPSVVFMLKHLKLSGCLIPSSNIVCAPCDLTRSGGFHPAGAIILCQGHFGDKKHMEDTLTHELVHMYDHCKFNVDWKNLRHHACSEIRANSLSGDCRYMRELGRGFVSFSKQHQACVRRRAILSVRANPMCPDEAAAERAVNEVWGSCFSDTRPFDEIY